MTDLADELERIAASNSDLTEEERDACRRAAEALRSSESDLRAAKSEQSKLARWREGILGGMSARISSFSPLSQLPLSVELPC